jgi:hypothetical protein
VYRFASVVPEANIAVLTPTGQTYDQAYALYLDNIAFQAPKDPKIEAELNAIAVQLTTLHSTIDNLLSTAENDYLNFVINGQGKLTFGLDGIFFEDPRDIRMSSELVSSATASFACKFCAKV